MYIIGLGVLLCVFNGFRYDLRADYTPGFLRKAERDGAGTAIEIQYLICRGGNGIFHSALIQPLRLGGMDLKECLRSNFKAEAAKQIIHYRSAPERVEAAVKHDVAFLFVDAEHNSSQLRTG